MNNDLKNFLEGEKVHVYQAMDSFLTEYDTFEGQPARRSLERLNQDRHLFVEQMKLHDTRLVNFVLDLVEKKVEKEYVLKSENNNGTQGEIYYGIYNKALEKVSTIINNLRV